MDFFRAFVVLFSVLVYQVVEFFVLIIRCIRTSMVLWSISWCSWMRMWSLRHRRWVTFRLGLDINPIGCSFLLPGLILCLIRCIPGSSLSLKWLYLILLLQSSNLCTRSHWGILWGTRPYRNIIRYFLHLLLLYSQVSLLVLQLAS